MTETRDYFGPSSEDDEEDADALQEPGPARVDVRQQARYGKTVGVGDAERYFPAGTREEAQASVEGIAAFCSSCPERDHCPEDECAVYRAEATAVARLRQDEELESVAGVLLPVHS